MGHANTDPESEHSAGGGKPKQPEAGVEHSQRVEGEVIVPPASRAAESRVEPEVVTGKGHQK